MLKKTVNLIMILFFAVSVRAEEKKNLFINGDFEEGTKGWKWDKKATVEPGFLDKDNAFAGTASYSMGLLGVEGKVAMRLSSLKISRDKAYVFSIVLRTSELPKNSIFIRLLQSSNDKNDKNSKIRGWIARGGAFNLVKTGGTAGWKKYIIKIPVSGLRRKADTDRLHLYIVNNSIGKGTLSIDNVSLIEVK